MKFHYISEPIIELAKKQMQVMSKSSLFLFLQCKSSAHYIAVLLPSHLLF